MENWKVVLLVGTILFLISAFLPLMTYFALSESLVNMYQGRGRFASWTYLFQGDSKNDTSSLGVVFLTILWPIALALCILSFFRKKTALVAGVVGILCWIGSIIYYEGTLYNVRPSNYAYGIGVYVGFLGAIIVLITRFLKLGSTTSQPVQEPLPPPPPPPQ